MFIKLEEGSGLLFYQKNCYIGDFHFSFSEKETKNITKIANRYPI